MVYFFLDVWQYCLLNEFGTFEQDTARDSFEQFNFKAFISSVGGCNIAQEF